MKIEFNWGIVGKIKKYSLTTYLPLLSNERSINFEIYPMVASSASKDQPLKTLDGIAVQSHGNAMKKKTMSLFVGHLNLFLTC